MQATLVTKVIVLTLSACAFGGLTGCGDAEDTSSADSAPATSTAPSTSPDVPASTSSGDGPSITPPGDLDSGNTAHVAHRSYNGGAAKDVTLAVSVVKVVKGSQRDLRRYRLDADQKDLVPFYVHVTWKNEGPGTLDASGISGTLNAVDASDDEVAGLNLIGGDFKKCEGAGPKKLPAGKTARTCDIYLADRNGGVSAVDYRDKNSDKYRWRNTDAADQSKPRT